MNRKTVLQITSTLMLLLLAVSSPAVADEIKPVAWGKLIESDTAAYMVTKYSNNPFGQVYVDGVPVFPATTHGVMISIKTSREDTIAYGVVITARLKDGTEVTRSGAINRWNDKYSPYTTEVFLTPNVIDVILSVEVHEIPPPKQDESADTGSLQ